MEQLSPLVQAAASQTRPHPVRYQSLIVDREQIDRVIESGHGDQLLNRLAQAYNYQNDVMFRDCLQALNDMIGTKVVPPTIGH